MLAGLYRQVRGCYITQNALSPFWGSKRSLWEAPYSPPALHRLSQSPYAALTKHGCLLPSGAHIHSSHQREEVLSQGTDSKEDLGSSRGGNH